MLDGDDDHPIGLDPIIDGIRESLQPTVPDRPVDLGVDFRIPLDQGEDSPNLGQELIAQASPTAPHTKLSFVDLAPDARLEDERQTHRDRLTYASISSQVTTSSGSASRAANR